MPRSDALPDPGKGLPGKQPGLYERLRGLFLVGKSRAPALCGAPLYGLCIDGGGAPSRFAPEPVSEDAATEDWDLPAIAQLAVAETVADEARWVTASDGKCIAITEREVKGARQYCYRVHASGKGDPPASPPEPPQRPSAPREPPPKATPSAPPQPSPAPSPRPTEPAAVPGEMPAERPAAPQTVPSQAPAEPRDKDKGKDREKEREKDKEILKQALRTADSLARDGAHGEKEKPDVREGGRGGDGSSTPREPRIGMDDRRPDPRVTVRSRAPAPEPTGAPKEDGAERPAGEPVVKQGTGAEPARSSDEDRAEETRAAAAPPAAVATPEGRGPVDAAAVAPRSAHPLAALAAMVPASSAGREASYSAAGIEAGSRGETVAAPALRRGGAFSAAAAEPAAPGGVPASASPARAPAADVSPLAVKESGASGRPAGFSTIGIASAPEPLPPQGAPIRAAAPPLYPPAGAAASFPRGEAAPSAGALRAGSVENPFPIEQIASRQPGVYRATLGGQELWFDYGADRVVGFYPQGVGGPRFELKGTYRMDGKTFSVFVSPRDARVGFLIATDGTIRAFRGNFRAGRVDAAKYVRGLGFVLP